MRYSKLPRIWERFEMEKLMTLKIVSPDGVNESTECDAVNLAARDNRKGEGGGSVGIRHNHLPAVIALEPGAEVIAKLNGSEVFRKSISGGFAMVKDNIITVLVD